VGKAIVDFAHACHAYSGGQATNHALMALADLSNDDKHRTIHTFASALAGIHHQHTFTGCLPLSFIPPEIPPRLEPDAVVGVFNVLVTAPDPQMDMGLAPQLYVVLDDGRPMLRTLNEIREQVEAILAAPEITTAL
jgi:hypothetical protein